MQGLFIIIETVVNSFSVSLLAEEWFREVHISYFTCPYFSSCVLDILFPFYLPTYTPTSVSSPVLAPGQQVKCQGPPLRGKIGEPLVADH